MFLKKILFDNLNVNSNKFGQTTIMDEYEHIKPKKWLRHFSETHKEHKNNSWSYLEKADEFLEVLHRLKNWRLIGILYRFRNFTKIIYEHSYKSFFASSFHTYNIHFFPKAGDNYAII